MQEMTKGIIRDYITFPCVVLFLLSGPGNSGGWRGVFMSALLRASESKAEIKASHHKSAYL